MVEGWLVNAEWIGDRLVNLWVLDGLVVDGWVVDGWWWIVG